MNGLQYEANRTYHHTSSSVLLCSAGFHYCRLPADCYLFCLHLAAPYRFWEVLDEGKQMCTDGVKSATDCLTFVREIGWKEWFQLCLELGSRREYVFVLASGSDLLIIGDLLIVQWQFGSISYKLGIAHQHFLEQFSPNNPKHLKAGAAAEAFLGSQFEPFLRKPRISGLARRRTTNTKRCVPSPDENERFTLKDTAAPRRGWLEKIKLD